MAEPSPVYIYLRAGYTGDLVTTEIHPGVMLDKTPSGDLIGIEVLDYSHISIDGDRVSDWEGGAMFVRMCVCQAKTDIHGPQHDRNCTMYEAADGERDDG